MATPIESRLGEMRRRVRRIVTIHGTSWLIVALLSIAVASALLDWLMNLTTGVRVILLLTLVGTALWTAYRLLVGPLLIRLRNVDLALQVESQYPALNDELASAVEFGEEPAASTRSGSPALKAAVVEQATRRLAAFDFGEALDWTAARRAATAATAIGAVTLALILASPLSAGIALARLVNPFGNTTWPRQTYLQLVDPPNRLARGDSFSFTVQVAQGRVPDRAEVHYKFDSGEEARDPLRPHSERQFIGGLESVTRSFSFHARAGDGETELHRVEVVPPPELTQLNLRLKHPAYTGLESEQLPQDKGQVRAAWGTIVELSALASKPIEHAELRINADQVVPAQLSEDRTQLTAQFTLEQSGSYWIALRDQLGFENQRASRYELRVIDDKAPEVFIEVPASDIQVTPTAQVPLRVTVKDDFGIQDAQLKHSGSAPETVNELPIWLGTDRPRRLLIEYLWRLEELGLTPGSSVSYRVTARDADDLRGPHVGQSRQLRLTVVTAEELARHLEEKQSQVYQDLERLRAVEVDARLQVNSLRDRLAAENALSQSDLARLQSAEMLQRQVRRQITSPAEGLQSKIAQIQQDLDNNHIRDAAVREQMDAIAAGLDQIARDHLPPIEQNLGRARKAAEESTPAQSQAADLAQAQEHQDQVIGTLDDLLEQMAKWETFRGIAREVRDLQNQQQQLAADTQSVGERTLGKSRDSLSSEDQAELSRIAARQEHAREQLGRVQRKMDQVSDRLKESDPAGAEAMREAVEGSRQSGTSELMQQAAGGVQQNQVGQAEAAQRQAAEDLKQMLDTLENNSERDLAKLVEKLRQAEAKLGELQRRQLEQLERTGAAQSQADQEQRRRELQQLARREKELQQEAARVAQQLRRLRAEAASQSSASAAGRMGQAGQQMQQGDGEQAQEEQQRVLEDLQKAKEEVAKARQEAEAQLAMEQLARIADTLAALYGRQKELKAESARLHSELEQKGNWTRSQLASLRTAVEAQQAVQTDTDKAREILTNAPVFALTLTRAMNNMEQATELLNNRQPGPGAQTAQQAAADRFAQLLDALKNDAAQQGESQEGGGGGGGGQQPPQDGIPPLAQLKMLRSLQIEINERTQELNTLKQDNGLSPAQQKELESLSSEQGSLADIVQNLLESADDAGDTP